MEWVTCENVYEESWRRLLEYANIELAIEAIENNHGKATKKTLQNYKKQANQIRVSLLQAKEYFEAAKASSLFTQPNHLYYGTVALSSACMLIKADGSHALDKLRQDKKNAHHGLDFNFSGNLKRALAGLDLLEDSHVKVCPNGHFGNWYKTLGLTQKSYALREIIDGHGGKYVSPYAVGSGQITKFEDITNINISLKDLIVEMPDLQSDLSRFGVETHTARGDHTVIENRRNKTIQHIFKFHSVPSEQVLYELIDEFKAKEAIFCYQLGMEGSAAIIKTKASAEHNFSYPSSRETLDHKTIYYSKGIDTYELAELYIISYSLSMLSRYYPDIWISFLESHCKGSKLVERIVRILIMKTPNLTLNQITNNHCVISTHRPHWHNR